MYPAALSDTDAAAVKASLKTAFVTAAAATKSFHAQGDSIIFGTGGSNNRTITAAMAERLAAGVLLRNNGIAGHQLSQHYQDYASGSAGRSRFVVDGVENIYVSDYGHNDIKSFVTDSATATSTVDTMKAQVRAMCADLRAAGYQKIIWQEAFADVATGWTADMENARDAWNAFLRSNPLDVNGVACFDAIDTVASDASFILSDAETDAGRGMKLTSLSSDGVHPNENVAGARAEHLIATYNNGTIVAPSNPTVTLSSAQSKNEGNSGATLFTYTVTRSNSTGAVSVPWSFSAGNTSADDFTGGSLPTGGNVAIADGVTSGTFSVSVNGDTTVEGNEAFTVSISAPSGYAAGASMSATGTILNDDAPAQTGYLLDNVTATPSGAYSMRRLRTAYSGPVLKVRRSSDNTTQDIGFTSGGDLDTTALLNFVGSGNGFVDTWYDQSPAAAHAVNTDAATQPQLVASGVLGTRNNKPSITFASGKSLAGALSASPSVRSLRFVGDHRSNANSEILRSSAAGGWNVRYSAAHALQLLVQGGSLQFTTTASETLNQQATFAIDWNAGAYSASIDGGTPLSGTATGTFTAGLTTIMGGASAQSMGLSTVLAFDGAILSNADSLAIQSSQKAYWGTP